MRRRRLRSGRWCNPLPARSVASTPYTAPPRSTFWEKLGPGGAASLGLALLGGVLVVPVVVRMRQVLSAVAGDLPLRADAILVLGRRLQQGDALSPVFEARLAHAADLWRGGLAGRIVVAGGLTGKAGLSEAAAGLAWLRAQGIPEAALHAEGRSQHTLENLYFVRELARAEGWQQLLLVSDALHLARARALAQGLRLPVRCSPAPGATPRNPLAWAWRLGTEAFFLHWYRTGVAYSRIIGSRRQLERIT